MTRDPLATLCGVRSIGKDRYPCKHELGTTVVLHLHVKIELFSNNCYKTCGSRMLRLGKEVFTWLMMN